MVCWYFRFYFLLRTWNQNSFFGFRAGKFWSAAPIISECTLRAYNDRADRNREYSLGLEWPQYEEFGRKVMLDERIRKMKRDRIEQLRSRAYEAALSVEEKANFWNVHHWWQSLSEEEKQAEKNLQDTQREISKRCKKS